MKGKTKLRFFGDFIFFGFFFACLAIAVLGIQVAVSDQISEYEELVPGNVNVFYTNLSELEVLEASKALSEVNPKFLILQNNITFSHYIKDECGPVDCAGVNQNNGQRIFILMTSDKIYLRYVLCHELLHTLITDVDHDLEEELVDEISKKFVCYKEPVRDENGEAIFYD